VFFLPSGSYLILPDGAKPLAGKVQVEGEQPADDKGGIFYVDVIVRKASLLEELIPALRPDGSELVPDRAIVPPGSNFEERRRQNLSQMVRSQQIAAAVALRQRGLSVRADPEGALIVAVAPDVPAAKHLRPTDVIVAVDGKSVLTPGDLRRLIAGRKPGANVRLRIRAGGAVRTETVRTIESPDEPGRAIVGIQVEQSAKIELPIHVDIDLGSVGGPSAGLAFALDVLEELGRDVDRGYKVAATGEIELDGDVAPIGGIVQKARGARDAGMDVFLVPAGDNARDARRKADGLRIIPVESFQQALRALATLPRKG
jgi:Lon-like protease